MTPSISAVLRRSGAVWIVPVLAVGFALAPIPTLQPGLRLWPDLLSGVSAATAFLLPLAAGIAAYAAAKWKSPLRVRFSYGKPRITSATLLHFALTASALLMGFIVGTLVLVLYAVCTHVYGSPQISWICAIGASLVCVSAFGYAFGLVIGDRWFTAPAAAFILLGGFIYIMYFSNSPSAESLYPVQLRLGDVFLGPSTWSFFWLSLFYLTAGLTVLAAAFTCTVARQKTMVLTVVAATAAAVIAGGTVIALPEPEVEASTAHDYVCDDGTPEVCVNRGYQAALPELERVYGEMYAKTKGTDLIGAKLEQHLEGFEDDTRGGTRAIYIEALDDEFAEYSAFRYIERFGGMNACQSSASSASASSKNELAVSAVDAWLSGFDDSGFGFAGTPGRSQYQRLEKLNTRDGNAWFREHADAYADCSLTLDELP